MNILINKKIIALAIIVVILMTVITPVFAAKEETSNSKQNSYKGILSSLFTVFTTGTKAMFEIGSTLLSSLLNTTTSTKTSSTSKKVDSWQKVYLTNYKPSDDNWGNLSLSKLGSVLKTENNSVKIINKNISTNFNNWYVYKAGLKSYVILAKLPDNNGNYCGSYYEIVKFKYNGVTYEGVILDCGGTRREYPSLDVFRTMNCSYAPGAVISEALPTGQYITCY